MRKAKGIAKYILPSNTLFSSSMLMGGCVVFWDREPLRIRTPRLWASACAADAIAGFEDARDAMQSKRSLLGDLMCRSPLCSGPMTAS